MRLDKIISNNTELSRKDVNKLLKKKIVKVNDNVVLDGSHKIDINNDVITIYDEEITICNFIYIALNKPNGYVCSNSNHDGESILNLIEENYLKDLHIVGRLDKDTTGLILITNDGHFTHQIKNSKHKVEKEYEVILEKNFTNEMNDVLNKGIMLDGEKLKPFKISNVNNNKLNITLIQGKYHQIKRMFEIVNNKVIKLKRIRIGKLTLKNLKLNEGEYTFVNKEDVTN